MRDMMMHDRRHLMLMCIPHQMQHDGAWSIREKPKLCVTHEPRCTEMRGMGFRELDMVFAPRTMIRNRL